MIQEECALEVQLIPGKIGEFTVRYQSEIIAQKKAVFPSFPEIVKEINIRKRRRK